MVAITATVGNFPERTRCTVISLLSSATSIGPMLYIAAYDAFFFVKPDYTLLHYPNSSDHNYINFLKSNNATDHNPKNTDERQDVGGYFMLVTVTYAIANILSLMFHGEYPPADDDQGVISDQTKEEEMTLLTSDSNTHKRPYKDDKSKTKYMSIDEVKEKESHGESSDEGYVQSDKYRSISSLSDMSQSSKGDQIYSEQLIVDEKESQKSPLLKGGTDISSALDLPLNKDLGDLYAPSFYDTLRMPLFHYIGEPDCKLVLHSGF